MHHARVRSAGGQRGQAAPELGGVLAQHHGPVLQHRTAHREGEAETQRVRLRPIRREGPQPRRLTAQGVLAPARQHPRHDRGGDRRNLVRLRVRLLRDRLLLDDHVRVGAAEPERGHARPARSPGLGPLPLLGQQFHRAGRPVHLWGGLVDVDALRQHAVAHRQHHLDDAGQTGRRLGVADVGLHRAQPQRPVLGTVLAVGRQQRLRLDRVAQRGARAVRLDRVHLVRRQTGVRQRLTDHPLLRGTVRRGQTVARTVLVDRGTAHDGQHRVTVAAGVAEPLDQQHARALGRGETVRGGREGLAAAVGGQALLTAELDEGARSGHHRDTTGQRQLALSVAQRLHSQVQSHQRGRAGGVHGHRRAFEAEQVRDTARHHAGRRAGGDMAFRRLRRTGQQAEVVGSVGAREDAGPAAAQGGRVDARPLERLPGGLQQQPLLRVHGQRLTWRDPEEGGVEPARVVQEAALADVGGALVVAVRVEDGVEVPAAVGGEVRQPVTGGDQQLPQVLGRGHPAGEPAAHADDRDRLVGGGPDHDRRDGRAHRARELLVEVADQRDGVGVVVDQRGGQLDPGGRTEPVAQLDGGQRVEAQLLERAAGVHRLRARVAQRGGDVRGHQVCQEVFALGGRETGEPGAEAAVGALRTVGDARAALQGPHRLGHLEQQRADPARGEGEREALPVDVGDGQHRLALVQRLLEGGDGQVGRHLQDAVAAHPVADAALGRHAALAPRPPGHRGGRQPVGAALLGQCVQERVPGCVVALAGRAEGGGEGGEEHEGGQVEVAGQLVQVQGGVDLDPQHPLQLVGGQRPDHRVVQHGGGVHHGGERPLGRDGRQQRGQRRAVRHVARGDRHLGAERGELLAQFGSALGVRAAAAGEQQMAGAVAGQPAGHVRAERAGAAGDQDGAVRPPRLPRRRSDRRVDQSAGVHAGAAQRELVLAAGTGQHTHQALQSALVELLGQVQQAAPARRVLQRGHPAQAPDQGLHGAVQPLGGVHRDRAARGGPHGRLDLGVAQRLKQGQRSGQTERHGRVVRAALLGRAEQGEHPCGCRVLGEFGAQPPGQRLAVQVRRTDHQLPHVGAVTGQRLGGVCHPRRVGEHVGHHEHPGAGEHRRGQLGQRLPDDPVAPAVHGGLLAALSPPGRQGRQHRAQRSVVGEVQRIGHRGQVLALHRGPELRLDRVEGRLAGLLRLGGGCVQPVSAALEGVGGQLDALRPGAREDGGLPVHRDAAHPRLGQRGRDPAGAALAASQRAHRHRRRVGLLQALLKPGQQHGVRADLDETVDAVRGHGRLDGLAEPHGRTEVGVPVRGVHRFAVEQFTGHGGQQRDPPGARGDPGQGRGQLLAQGFDLGGVRGVADLHPAGPDPVRLAGGEQFVQRLRVARDDHRGRAVDGRD